MSEFKWGIRLCGVFLLLGAGAGALPAQTFTTLHSFDNTDGQYPYAGLVQGTEGYLYGTTYEGGANGYGTVFKITPSGTLTTLYNFCPQPQNGCTDGKYPAAGLVQATDGNFYGTTAGGGASNDGTVFKITPGGTLTTLHIFAGSDGKWPGAALVQATNGDFYGTTAGGGANTSCETGCGTVFKITPSGKLKTLHSFDGADGEYPSAGLVQATDGNFYGTMQDGGANKYYGTVFKITPNGTLTTLHSFDYTDGSVPGAGLVQGTDGKFYGTTVYGGANACSFDYGNGCGTVFSITPNGKLATLYNFCSQRGCTDGSNPDAALVQATDGNFYGTTFAGGANDNCSYLGCGTAFKITPSATLTTLYSYCSQLNCTDGTSPEAGLVQATNGKFYGTTQEGGAYGNGTVFSLSVGLGPFVETNPASGKVGMAVKVLGTNLTGVTSVTFNGTTAAFTVKSKSEITTTVPTGATTGTVQAVTPSGTLSSNAPFRVTP